jgi:ribonuclease HI
MHVSRPRVTRTVNKRTLEHTACNMLPRARAAHAQEFECRPASSNGQEKKQEVIYHIMYTFRLTVMKCVLLTTDGACIGNPGPGGWACILRYKEHRRELFGCELHTTNNRMELRAVIEGLSALREPCRVTVRTDSQYLMNGITKWIHGWKKNGWVHHVRGIGKQPVKNQVLWEGLDDITHKHEVTWEWVKGHSTDRDNIRCDRLATRAARQHLSCGNPRMLETKGTAQRSSNCKIPSAALRTTSSAQKTV